MKKLKKKDLGTISIILCILGAISPYLISHSAESKISMLSVALASISTIATLITLFIAIHIYERFGLDSKFVGNQTDKVLEVVDFLKGRMIIVESRGFHYWIRFNREHLKITQKTPLFDRDRNKSILIINEDFDSAWNQLLEIKRSYWLPEKIKKKIEFLEIGISITIDNPEDDNFVKLNFGGGATEKKWSKTYPEMTFGQYINHLDDLTKSLEKWLKRYSNIKINLRLEEIEKRN